MTHNIREVLVSVLIAVYNEEKHIAECIESIIRQTYKPIEIIVIDDGSTDKTARMVQEFKFVKLISLGHTGKANAINFGAKQAKGEILIFLDGDLYYERKYIEKMTSPIIDGICIGTSHADEYVANPYNLWSKCLQIKSGLPADKRFQLTPEQRREGSIIFRAIKKDIFINVGGFDNTGYLDDQTLSPKVGKRAQWIIGATCYHYNPETLHDVFYSGKWWGKTLGLLHRSSTIIRYLPFLSIPRSFYYAVKFQYPAMLVYEFAFELGICIGLLEYLLNKESPYGK